MNMVYASIYLYLSQFISSVFYSFPSTGLLPPWLNLFLGKFFVIVDMVNGIFFFVSLFDSSLLVYKSAIDFWILTLHPTTLPNSLMRSSSFLVESIGFSMYTYTILSSTNNDSFTSSFPISMPLISSSCLIAMARLPVLCWIGVVKEDILVLFMILRGKLLAFACWVWWWL